MPFYISVPSDRPSFSLLPEPHAATPAPLLQALDLVKSGKAMLVDVRLDNDFEGQHAKGAVSVPMYRITAGDGTWDKIKRVAMASIFMKATGGWGVPPGASLSSS